MYIALIVLVTAAAFLAWEVRRRNMQRWLGPYLRQRLLRPRPAPGRDVHLILCIADHYEPKADGASKEVGQARVDHWVEAYPRLFGDCRDSDGRPPRYTFFFPIEEYEPEYLAALTELCRQGFAEVEIHLHHEADTAEGLRQKLATFRDVLANRHGLLSRHKDTGELAYAFIHGNWALCNSYPGGLCCGVNEELTILRQTGCFVDMTYPSAPHPTQPPRVNSIYYACDRPGRPRSHETGNDVGLAPQPDDSLMLIQGPLLLDWAHRKWSVLPRLENGCLQASQPPDANRVDRWLKAAIQVPKRPDWYFVKLHAHGAPEESHGTLLGEPMVRFHQELAQRAQDDPRFHYHYVTVREMYNLVKAAEAGHRGAIAEALDFLLVPNLAVVDAIDLIA